LRNTILAKQDSCIAAVAATETADIVWAACRRGVVAGHVS
jgi:hypothetical protein